MSIAPVAIPRVARIELLPVRAGPMQYPRQIDNDLSLIGSGDACDICLNCDKVAEAHAALVRIGPAIFLCDLGSPDGTNLNDKRVRCERLKQGQIISIGSVDFRVQIVGDAPASFEVPSFTLRCPSLPETLISREPAVLVGSDPSCDFVLSDTAVAPRHALVAWTTHGPMIRDLAGTYSVMRNGRRVRTCLLNNGDKIAIGSYELIFETTCAVRKFEQTDRTKANKSEAMKEPISKPPAKKAAPKVELTHLPELKFSPVPEISPPETTAKVDIPSIEELILAESPEISPTVETVDTTVTSRLREIDDNSERFKARVEAAQQALDERARKLWEGLNQERERLSQYHTDLHEKAKKLLDAATAPNPERPNSEPVPPFIDDGSPMKQSPEILDRVFGGEYQPAAATFANVEETTRALYRLDGQPLDAEVQQQAAHLTELLRRERREMDMSEARLEALRFDVERLKSIVARSGERHRARQTEIETRSQSLRRAQQTLDGEREALAARMRQLETKQTALQARIDESQQHRKLVDQEGVQLAKAKDEFESRRIELRSGLETERQRLRLRQAELQAKASELARVARQRRESIEARASQEQAALEEHEKQIRAQRQAIEEASRVELDRTATELEHVLSARLSDIESEITTRQSDLSNWMEALVGQDSSAVLRTPVTAEYLDKIPDVPTGDVDDENYRLANLQREIGDLQQAIRGIGNETGTSPPPKRWSNSMKSRLSEKIATLRNKSAEQRDDENKPIPFVGEAPESSHKAV